MAVISSNSDSEAGNATAREDLGFSGGSVSKESTRSAEGTGSVPGFRRSPGERNGNPLQHSWENPVGAVTGGLQSMGSQELDST